jgi:hypothetical protein
MQVRDFKKSTGGFIHGFRYTVRSLHRMLEQKYHGESWPHRAFAAEPEALGESVIARVNRSSALWQQFACLCDLIVVSKDRTARYYEELPLDYVREKEPLPGECHFTISLEYGSDHDRIDPFDISVNRIAQDDPESSHDARYLHPVVRFYRGREMVAEHHVAENLENEWNGPAHRLPLVAFFAQAMAKEQTAAEVAA